MIRSFLFQIVYRISFISILSFISGALFSGTHDVAWGFFSIAIIIYLIIDLCRYVNAVNHQVNYFFEAILNDDFSSVYAIKRKSRILDKLNDNLNRVNKKLQNALMTNAQQEQYFRALIEHIGTGVVSYNEEGFILHANSRFLQLIGLDHLTHISQLKKIGGDLFHTLQVIKHKEQKIIQIPVADQKNRVKVLMKAIVFHNGNEKLRLLAVQDIEKELNDNEVDSWMKLIRVLTHEIMNAIAPITSLSETLSSLYSVNGVPISQSEVNEKMISTTIRGLDVIKEQGTGLIHFVESYRSLMKLPKPKKEAFALISFLENALLILQRSGVDLRINCIEQYKGLYVEADKELITQVVANLVKNAIQASENSENPLVELEVGVNDNDQIFVSIKDNGPGIDEEILDQIFIPFYTTKENGSGIGLSLSRQIMRLHGGWLNVQSHKNKGAVFTMVFP
jgi:nitrogen fixation/metabolism regulation signal transduction histidine kinase